MKNYVNVHSKSNIQKKFYKQFVFVGILKVNDEKQDPDPNLDPDPLVRDMDPRIWIHTKMSWIRNIAAGFLTR